MPYSRIQNKTCTFNSILASPLSLSSLFDHLVRPLQHAAWNCQTDLFGGLEVMTNSNFVACCTGKSAGLAPFKILST